MFSTGSSKQGKAVKVAHSAKDKKKFKAHKNGGSGPLSSNKPQTSSSSQASKHAQHSQNSSGAKKHSNSQSGSRPQKKGSTESQGLTSLQEQFKRKLEGARFRAINEELYTHPGDEAFADFQEHPEKFEVYHKGYREQAALWPRNPLDDVVAWIRRTRPPPCAIADMGCGDARLAATLLPVGYAVHSFDLVSVNERVVACNIAHTPLPPASVDIVVFCLSLMGVDFHQFLFEAHRILRAGGFMKIVEVRSRIEGHGVKEKFFDYLQQCGFRIDASDSMRDNTMFFDVTCCKDGPASHVPPTFSLKSCQYKKR